MSEMKSDKIIRDEEEHARFIRRMDKAMKFGETYGMRGSLREHSDNVERQSQASAVMHPVGLFQGMNVNCIHDSVVVDVPIPGGSAIPLEEGGRIFSLRKKLESAGFNVVGISPTPSRLDMAKCIVPDFSHVELRVLADLNRGLSDE